MYSLILLSWSIPINTSGSCHAFVVVPTSNTHPVNHHLRVYRRHSQPQPLRNIYDDWRSDAIVDTMYLDEDNVRSCLEEFIESDYGQEMFGCHTKASSIGITGSIAFVELSGPEVTLQLDGQFWHRRETVLGRAAVWLNARIPEITDVVVPDMSDLQDYEEIIDEVSGEVLFRRDKRSPDFNGDRETMEYQGLDPDVRGPFPPGAMTAGSSMINPI
jgi:hypothetical protein